MQLYQLYEYLKFLLKQNPVGGGFSVNEFNRIIPVAELKYFRDLFKLPSNWVPGKPLDVYGVGITQFNRDKLRPLLKQATISTLDADGKTNIPSDYLHYSSAVVIISVGTNQPVTFLNDQEFDAKISSSIDSPDDEDVIARTLTTEIEFNPTDIDDDGDIIFSYYKTPSTPVLKEVQNSVTLEKTYIDQGASFKITVLAAAGNTITLAADAQNLGTYTIQSGDTIEDVMIALAADINLDIGTHDCKAIYNGEYIYLDDQSSQYTNLNVTASGTTYVKSNFSTLTTESDWVNDTEAMNKIADHMLNMVGISNREIPVVQWVENEMNKK